MKSLYIKIDNITDVVDFVRKATEVSEDILVKKGVFCVDAKSVMGMFSLDLSTGVTVEYPETALEFENFIINYKVG